MLAAQYGDSIAAPGIPSEIAEIRLRALWELSKRDPLLFLKHFAWTRDSHHNPPERRFPVDKPHIQHLVALWMENRLLSVVKCRQIMGTWLFVALNLWLALSNRGQLIMFQSKRLEDAVGDENSADGLLGRAKVIMNLLPGRQILVPGYQPQTTRLIFRDTLSTIWAIPQGADIIRQRTASSILVDEAAFHEEAAAAYTAARPCIRGGGRFTSLTTAGLADGGHTRRLHEDKLDEA